MGAVYVTAVTGSKNWKADIAGGISAAIIALPLALGFGVAALQPLGPEYQSTGALAGLIGAIVTGIFASVFGGTPCQITGPTGPMTVVTTATVTALLAYRGADGAQLDGATVLLMTFLCVGLGGLVQIIMGALRTGVLIKFIPSPVIAGFMNGIAVLIFLQQIDPALGITDGRWFKNLHAIPPILWTTVITIVVLLLMPRLTMKVPASLIALLVGTATYLTFGATLYPSLLVLEGNPFIIGEIPSGIPMPKNVITFFSLFTRPDALSLLGVIAGPALALGALGSIDSLLTSLVADISTKTRHDSNRELIGQGIGNIGASIFSGFAGAGATVRTLVNVNAGGRGRLSGVTHGVFLVLVLVLLGRFAAWIPMSVLAGILLVTSVKMFDTFSLELIRHKTALPDLAVIVLVTSVTVTIDLMIAVGLGVLLTGILFIRQLVKQSIVRRKGRCKHRRSKRVRPADHEVFLETQGDAILIFELRGSLFFGTTDALSNEVEANLDGTDLLVLDLRDVETIDLSGAELIKRTVDRVKDRGCQLLLSGLDLRHVRRKALVDYLTEIGVFQVVTDENLFADLDLALEEAENRLIMDKFTLTSKAGLPALRSCVVFSELEPEEWEIVEAHLRHQTYKTGEKIFSQGDVGDRMCVINAGHASVYVALDHLDKPSRMAAFGPSMHFGEMAFLDATERFGSVIADEYTEIHSLSRDDFLKLQDEHPVVARKLLTGMIRGLADRLRVVSEEVLEHDSFR